MSEQPEANSPEEESKTPEPESSSSPDLKTPTNDEDKEESTSNDSTEKSIEDWKENAGKNIGEFFQGLGVANVYIDARSGGAYFSGDTKIEGDAVGRSKYTLSSTSASTSTTSIYGAGTILSAEIKKIRSVYVKTSCYGDAQNILNKKHILILWGDSHLGKRTTAIHLLLSLSQAEGILEIDPTLEEEKLKTFQVEKKGVYFIDTLTPDSAVKLNNYTLGKLGENLRKQGSYLVITVDGRVQFTQEFAQYILDWKDLPDSKTSLEKHLTWYLENHKHDNSLTFTQIQQEKVKELLDNKLIPGEVDRLAELLAKVIRNDLSFEEALADFTGQVKQQVESWFDQEQDVSQRVFMIALAVLNGSKYQLVIDASQSLQSLIEPPSEKEETSNSEPKFKKKRSERLKEVNAHLTQGYENTESGRSPVELIELDNSAFQPAILAYVWNEYDFYRDNLLEWIHDLGVHSNFDVKIRVAAAAGEISRYAFKDVLDKVIRPWAKRKSVQKLAILALSIPVFDGNLAPQVLKLLNSWRKDNQNLQLRCTAASAYGSYIGLRFPDIALRGLLEITNEIAQSRNTKSLVLPLTVAESLVILFEAGKFVPDHYFLILKILKDWISQPKSSLQNQLGLLIFWMLMREAKVPGESNQGYWPTLLRLAKEDSVYEEIVIQLLQCCLNQKELQKIGKFPLRKLVLEAIQNWLRIVDQDPRLYPILGQIIFQLVIRGTTRERLRILNKLEAWKMAGELQSARKIFSKINKELNT